MKILVIIPAFNEEQNLPGLFHKLQRIQELLQFDIVVVNDKSSDGTSAVSRRFQGITIDLPVNLGIGGAVQTGYKYAAANGYDIAIQVDGDGQHNPEYIVRMVEMIRSGQADMVIGSRFLEGQGFQSTFLRRIGIKYFSAVIRLMTRMTVTDPTSGFRACSKEIIQLFAMRYPQDYPEPESLILMKRFSYKVKEIPVLMNERRNGTSSINLWKSVYYMVKVTAAIMIDSLRKQAI
ncbi:glycosyltransferase family 2 protein [Paenibacillus chartarius]|uniref:Glycosyltransferase family 2 protein n=1 Tax=Paenibacillus chartarius TaxID=747481 RepID=A0ABV6DRD4_9BACL